MNLWIIGCLGVGLIGAILLIAFLFVSAMSKMPRSSPQPETTPLAQVPLGIPVPPGRFAPAPGQAVYVDLDTQSGHNSSWRKEDVSKYSALYARLTVMRLGEDPRWQPVFWIGLQAQPGQSFRDDVGMRIVPVNGGSELALEVARVDARRVAERHTFSAQPRLNQQLGITIDWATPNRVTFTLSDGEVQSVAMPWRVAGASIYASTGEIVADPLQLGTMAPNARSGPSSH